MRKERLSYCTKSKQRNEQEGLRRDGGGKERGGSGKEGYKKRRKERRKEGRTENGLESDRRAKGRKKLILLFSSLKMEMAIQTV
jgi:hypothetical protein